MLHLTSKRKTKAKATSEAAVPEQKRLAASKRKKRRMSTKKKILIGLLIFLLADVILLAVTMNRYRSYDVLDQTKYVTFDMPEADTISTDEWNKLVNSADVESYPSAQLRHEEKVIREQYQYRMEEYGMTEKEYLKESGLTSREFDHQIEDMAKKSVKEKLILHAIAQEKKITISKDEMDKAKAQLIKDRGAADESEYKKLTGETIDQHAEDIDLESKLIYNKFVKD